MENTDLQQQKCLHCGTSSGAAAFCCDACEKLYKEFKVSNLSQKEQNPFSYLDESSFRELYYHNQSEFNYVFYAEGLHCSSCVHLLEKLPEFYDGVESARVNFGYSTVSVRLKPQASLAQTALIIKELGYEPAPLAAKDDFQEKYTQENRQFLKRIAVAGACAGNIMLFVIPVYSGLAGEMATLFNWMSFILYLPILFYSATPFYSGAWNSLKYKVINVDLPITVAMLSSVMLSTYNLVRGDGDIYYDSTASFMFLILSARYLLKRTQQNYLSPSQMKEFFKNERYLVLSEDGSYHSEPAAQIAMLSTVKVVTGQTLPTDCELLTERAIVDTSLFNGESFPHHFVKGMKLFGGTKLLSEDVLVKVLSTQSDSKVGSLLRELDQSALQKTSFLALTDRLAQYLIVFVFSVAAIFLAVYSQIDFHEAFNRSLALIVLACPCALAFGSPLTFGLALKKAQSLGVLIRDGTVLERIRKVRNLFFDKTGTLTKGQLELSHSEPEAINSELRLAILGLESRSYHPIAFALRSAWQDVTSLPDVQERNEILGLGIKGKVFDKNYEIKTLSDSVHDSELAIGVYEEGQLACRLYFTDQLRQESQAVITKLQQLGIQSHLLTGDRRTRALDVAAACGIAKENVHAELYPEDKKEFVKSKLDTCMIGDGANDSLALKTAGVGIAVKGSVELSLSSADVHFTRGGLLPLLDLLTLSQTTEKVLKRNLIISLVYNLIGGTLALMGFIDPMLAAVLMPLSSLAIIASSLWGFK
ncbi:MAG: heavy metal translocating P-type ATPase [Bdellovibrionia bacterium]